MPSCIFFNFQVYVEFSAEAQHYGISAMCWMMMVLSCVLLFESNHLAKVNVWNLNVLVLCCLLYRGNIFMTERILVYGVW